MVLEINGSVKSEHPDRGIIEQGLKELTGIGDSFSVLSKSEMSYVQTSGCVSDGFLLEYQDGSLERHYKCSDDSIDLQRVTNAFIYYLENDSRFSSEYSWQKQDVSENTVELGDIKTRTLIETALSFRSSWIVLSLIVLVILYIIIRGFLR